MPTFKDNRTNIPPVYSYTSRWKKGDKRCTVYSEKEVGCADFTFRITGHNPLPCKSFKGAYKILADWLVENGWERDFVNHKYLPDVCVIKTHQ